MDLCYENDAKLVSRLLPGSARLEDPRTNVYHIPGYDVHGMASALAALDTETMAVLLPKLQQFVNTGFTKRRGPYKVRNSYSSSFINTGFTDRRGGIIR